ncbi:MAG: poly-gamma-glutamate biosynthesis protein [Flavobacteria bacterium RIFCSPLOWO2_12_FULL_35_11]|nr:MAG: poly-gamma-glutamate biosynthesis protein [Flavobacteria bacterium RIFCSPLOWO2_12_FULL_35_11]
MGQHNVSETNSVKLFLCGDVMLGRGIDQILPHSVNPKLYESYVTDARDYVRLAEIKNGPIPQLVSFSYIWGDAMEIWKKMAPSAKIINLETSVTTHNKPWAGKGINYRMHPKNVEVLSAANINFCSLANNHTLDWERAGLLETMNTLKKSGILFVGAGINDLEAATPASLPLQQGKIIVLAYAAKSSGIPKSWAAEENSSGVNMLPENDEMAVGLIKNEISKIKKKNDVVVLSLHWGGNWGYDIPLKHQKLAHEIIDKAGVAIVHGHSSHHPKGIEVYHNKLIIYGAGDFINDYEGIGGYEQFRGELSLMYFPEVNQENGELISMKIFPMETKNFRLHHPSKSDALWLKTILNREGIQFGTQFKWNEDHSLDLEWK